MIGLGVSVDYSLFVISRYTQELRGGRDRLAALTATLRTSGTAVASSGLIVVLAMCSLFLVDLNVIESIALGIIVVVAFAVLASVLVLPVVLYLLGDRVLKGALRLPGRRQPSGDGPWYRAAQQIMRGRSCSLACPLSRCWGSPHRRSACARSHRTRVFCRSRHPCGSASTP